MLYIVSTPIGNIEDITFRAIKTLKNVDFIACEDTRHSGLLLQKLKISSKKIDENGEEKSKLISFHSYSNDSKVEKIMEILRKGKSVAIISDAGTPGISDPAYEITSKARKEGIKIEPIPGCSAFLTALQGSGLPINQFTYLGFIPAKKGRESFLREILENQKNTVVFYESVHRVKKLFEQVKKIFGKEKKILVSRELTKKFEEFFYGNADECLKKFENPKGEFVIIIEK
ncbi:16S rRNA (cytidine(1402)-2'-O)-methyltransferase [Candidatus Gracilibacteria bacterium]|nr:16S rRNA (cytidine(1402)-2'-O)-methyltransferase [Candidatus Gracilibacteria bacterium]